MWLQAQLDKRNQASMGLSEQNQNSVLSSKDEPPKPRSLSTAIQKQYSQSLPHLEMQKVLAKSREIGSAESMGSNKIVL